jgi:nicotinate-nucleotide pyrophosphorylase (carboxylating)
MVKHEEIVDIRDIIFESIMDAKFTAQITAEREGLISGSKYAFEKLMDIGVDIEFLVADGKTVSKGDLVAKFEGNPKQITLAEEIIIGKLAKTSGIATASNKASKLGGESCKIASGAWKKMPPEIKDVVREAIVTGGASPRLFDVPFVYLDKNYVRIFGSISKALEATKNLEGYIKVVQLKAETGSIEYETREAVKALADVIMVDTGKIEDAIKAINILKKLGVRSDKKVAFAKGVKISDIPRCREVGIDLLCIGKEIVDAPLLDMKLDIVPS